MSDFLSGFSEKKDGQSPKDTKSKKTIVAPEVKAASTKTEAPLESEKTVPSEVEQTAPTDKTSENKELESNNNIASTDKLNEDVSSDMEQEKTYLREEPTEFDPSYKKKQTRMKIMIAAGVVLALIVSGFAYYFTSTVKMVDFKDKNITEVREWANSNRIEVDSETEFSNEIALNTVIGQDIAEGKRIKKGSRIKINLSKGSDPDEVLGLMSFEGTNEKTIREWIEKNKIENLKVTKIFDEVIPSGDFIRVELLDKDLSAELFKRKDAGTIYVSKGTETFEKTIVVLDFKDKNKSDVETFRTTNKFKNNFIYEEVYSDTIEIDKVISQSVAKDEKVGIDDVLTIVISKGKARVVPNYAGTNKDTFMTVDTNGMNITQLEWYSNSVPFGQFISQTVGAGADVTDDPGFSMQVYYSAGQPYLKSLKGTAEGDLAALFFAFNSKGTNLTYVVQYRESCVPKGQVYETSHDDQHIGMNEKIWVTVSSGSDNCPIPTD